MDIGTSVVNLSLADILSKRWNVVRVENKFPLGALALFSEVNVLKPYFSLIDYEVAESIVALSENSFSWVWLTRFLVPADCHLMIIDSFCFVTSSWLCRLVHVIYHVVLAIYHTVPVFRLKVQIGPNHLMILTWKSLPVLIDLKPFKIHTELEESWLSHLFL